MAMFDYAMILASIVIGLAITHLIQGVAGMIQERDSIRIWWVHLLWVLYMLINALAWWWFEYGLHSVVQWTFQMYLFVMLYAFGVYFASALLFPRESSSAIAYDDYFISNRRWFLGLQIALQLLDLTDTALKGSEHFRSLGVEYPIAAGASVVIAGIGIATPRKDVQAFVALAFFIYHASWLPRLFLLLH